MASPLNSLYSIINRYTGAKDSERAFTFIEFIKEFGYDNSSASFLNDYKDYLSQWSKVKKDGMTDEKELIKNSFIAMLKNIILDYSSYEEQDFLANLDWNNPKYRSAILPFFAEKIKNITDIFKKKRAEVPYIINKHQFKGSRKSLEQIIYNKILDYYFNNKNLNKEEIINRLKENLSISIEQYVDIYSDYFDVPRYYDRDEEEREALINKYLYNFERSRYYSSNINDVDYNYFLNINTVLNEILMPDEVNLEELPFTAKMGLDLSGNCVGDVSKLRDDLLYNATLNQLTLNDQMGIRQRLYKKYLGCDLYYIYVDDNGNVSSNLLVKADNPSGNLLNCGNADVGAIENNEIELLSNIGLFFHPDKTGILKTNINNYEWEVDYDKLTRSTVYIFPDPSKYGNIGKNKRSDYPLIMEYRYDSYIRNASSGIAAHEPMGFAGDTYANSYYSKQDEDYRLIDNKNFEYSFTGYLNKGIIKKYATDIFGNEYALLHEFKTEISEDGEKIEVITPPKFKLPAAEELSNSETNYVSLNGGYIIDPDDLSYGDNNAGFDYDTAKILISERYRWSGLKIFGGTFGSDPGIEILDGWMTYEEAAEVEIAPNQNTTSFKLPLNFGSNHVIFGADEYKNIIPTETLYFTNSLFEYIDYYGELGYQKTLDTSTNEVHSSVLIDNIKEQEIGIETDSSLTKFKESNNSIILKNKNSLKSSILKFNDENINSIKDFFIFADKLFIIGKYKIDNNIEHAIIVYKIIPDFIHEHIKTIIFESDKFRYLYNESEEKIYTIELIDNGDKVSIRSFDIYDINKEEKVLIDDTDTANFKYEIKEDQEFSMTFSYNNNLQKYLLCYALSDFDGMDLYVHEFKLKNKDNFLKTLISKKYNNKENG